jgi:predicted amidohydrolase
VSELTPPSSIRAAAVQTDPRLGEVASNLRACLERLEAAAAGGCDLVVFTECALSGYMLDSREEAWRCAEPVPGPSTEALAEACARTGAHCVIGLLEADGDVLRNTAVLVGPGGLVGRYRKSHIACIGVDRFTVPGDDPYEVLDTPIGRIGIQICYDWRFPEITRVLALQGADVIAHPTNSPVQARDLGEYMTRARAAENAVFFITANRCGRERGTEFFGWSQIVDPLGRRIGEAGAGEETVTAVLDLALARAKTKQPGEGGYQVRLFDDRRPELYAPLATPVPADGGRFPDRTRW